MILDPIHPTLPPPPRSAFTPAYHPIRVASSPSKTPILSAGARSFADGRPPDPLPCQSCLNSHDKSFVGGWVAEVVLGNPVGDVLMGFMDQEVGCQEKRSVALTFGTTLGKTPAASFLHPCNTNVFYWQ